MEINRRTLGKQVFAHPHLRKQLEQIVHPYVIRALKRFAKQHTGVIAMDIPLLLETGLKPLVDQTVVVYATRSQQIQRLLRRNHLSRREALLRIRSQWPLTRKRASADIVILNTRDKGFLRLQIKRFIELLKNRLT
jgi:dephospho-CoA kinase